MNLKKFHELFGTESKCYKHFINYREEHIITCKKCGCISKHYYIKTRKLFQCPEWLHRISYKVDTILENSKIPIRYWYLAFYIVSNSKKPISALELQRFIGHKYYEPVWKMMHKIRSMMGIREDEYRLSGLIEMDETYIQTAKSKATKEEIASRLSQ